MSQAPETGYRPGECFVGAARKASRRLTQFYDDALAPCGLRSTQYSILSELTRFSSAPTLAELASALVSDRSAVGHNLRPLTRDGYIALEPGPNDRRERRIVLTPQGQSKHREALRALAGGPERVSRSPWRGSEAKASAQRSSTSPMTHGSAEPAGLHTMKHEALTSAPAARQRPVRWVSGRRARVLLCASGVSFMIMLDSNIVAVSLPSIARDLNATFADIEWVVSAYVLTFAALLMPSGALADRFGRRRMLTVGLAIFTAGVAAVRPRAIRAGPQRGASAARNGRGD